MLCFAGDNTEKDRHVHHISCHIIRCINIMNSVPLAEYQVLNRRHVEMCACVCVCVCACVCVCYIKVCERVPYACCDFQT